MIRLFQQRGLRGSLKVRALPKLSLNVRYNAFTPSQQQTSQEPQAEQQKSPSQTEPDQDVPWYLREDITSELMDQRNIELPLIPEHAPAQVEEFVNLLAMDYGMDNVLLFDMTELPEEHKFKENNKNIDFIIISTGKSEKHIYKAANELRIHLKHKYNTTPLIEGMVSSAKTPAMRRRLLRRARKGPLATDNDYGRTGNSWVMCNHENVDVHMMTAPRREELNLESLWCKPQDLHMYTSREVNSQESDSIFSGIRRFHTMTNFRRSYSLNSASLETYHYQLSNKLDDLDDQTILQLKDMFEDAFKNPSIQDYNVRFQFWKSLHLARPELFTFEDAENALLAKYASPQALTKDLSQQKVNDVAEYAKLLLDTPSRMHDKLLTDDALNKLSQFISVLYRFSSDKLSLSGNPVLLPILWRLCYLEHGNVPQLTPKTIDNVIHENHDIVVYPSQPLITLASNNCRDILSLIDYYTQKVDVGSIPTHAMNELILFTYGNASKWDKFWNQWDVMCFTRTIEPPVAVERWTRLAVYLSSRGVKSQMRQFLLNYWDNSNSVGGSFLKSFKASGEKFNSDNEASAFRRAIEVMVNILDTGDKAPFEGIRKYVEGIEHVYR